MTDILINYIKNELTRDHDDVVISEEDDLLGSGLIDSLGMMKFIGFIEETFDTKIPPEDLIIENFMTISCISSYLEKNK